MYNETSLSIRTSVIQLPHLLQHLLPTVHYTTAPSFIQFPHFMHKFHPERMCADKWDFTVL